MPRPGAIAMDRRFKNGAHYIANGEGRVGGKAGGGEMSLAWGLPRCCVSDSENFGTQHTILGGKCRFVCPKLSSSKLWISP